MRSLDIDPRALSGFLEAANSSFHVKGSTHQFYRYPGRFSPTFARSAIQTFSRSGDTVLDPFLGGGTSAIEAILLGRRYVGTDVNPLSVFVSRVKTTPLFRCDVEELISWQSRLETAVNARRPSVDSGGWAQYQRHVPWWLRKALEQALGSTRLLQGARQRRFARCSLLKTAQWALDCRRRLPATREFLAAHKRHFSEMIQGNLELSATLAAAGSAERAISGCRLLQRSAEGLEVDRRIPVRWKPIDLVVTSPPYMGVHVLYHRWQVMSRMETSAPYWIAGLEDGHAASFYTFGGRRQKDWSQYLTNLSKAFSSVAAMIRKGGLVIQLVGYSEPRIQVEPYLDVLSSAGLEEVNLRASRGWGGRVWRDVPNRRWYAGMCDRASTAREVLLVHRKPDD